MAPKKDAGSQKTRSYQSASFDYSLDFSKIDFRKQPDLYRIGRGEQGVLMVEPYKSEILPHWRFKNVEAATASADVIHRLFCRYKREKDFVGMDMARKFLQMGYTRARRYANHASGRKYAKNPQKEGSPDAERLARKNVLPQEADWATNEKAMAAQVFYKKYELVKNDPGYQRLRAQHERIEQLANTKGTREKENRRKRSAPDGN